MSNHYHLLARTPRANLDKAMQWFMRETSRSLVFAGNRKNQSYGGPYYRTIIGTNHYYLNAYKYLYCNPVKAGICESVADYPYSTLHGLLGKSRLAIPVEEDLILFNGIETTLQWLDRKPTHENWESVKRALRREEFTLPKQDSRNNPLEIDTL